MTAVSHEQAVALEALTDDRLGVLPADAVPDAVIGDLRERGLLEDVARASVLALLADRAASRPIEWGTLTTTQGAVLEAFAAHCRDELDDVEVVSVATAGLVVRWRTEVSRFELRNGFLGVERLASDTPTMLLGDVDPDLEALVAAFVDRPELRARLALADLVRLERLGTVRSSAFVYFEWFLRDASGVKLLPSPRFTQGLIDRGVISLGMG